MHVFKQNINEFIFIHYLYAFWRVLIIIIYQFLSIVIYIIYWIYGCYRGFVGIWKDDGNSDKIHKSLIRVPAHQLKMFKNLQSFGQFLCVPHEETEAQRAITYPDKTDAKLEAATRSPDISICVFIPLFNSGS